MPRYAFVIFVGAVTAFYQNQLPDRCWVALVPILLLLAWAQPRNRVPWLFIAAYLWCSGLLHLHLDYRVGEEFDGRQVQVEGVIADIVEVKQGRLRFAFEPLWIESYPEPLPRLLRLNWYKTDARPVAGEKWRLEIKLKRPDGYLNPGGFDYQAWLFGKGVDGLGYVRTSPENRRLEAAHQYHLNGWRERFAASFAASCTACEHTGLFQALVLGFRGNIDPGQRDLLRATGTAHLLAISGLHVGLIAGMCFGLGRIAWRHGLYRTGRSRLEVALPLAFCGALLYSAMAGFSLPTVRALVMLIVVSIAVLVRQKLNLVQSISLALIAILICDPRAVGSVSFWLSIGAVMIIAIAQPRLNGVGGWWRQLLLLQCYFALLMLPFGLLFFGQATPASFVANLVAIPLVAFLVLPGSLLAGFWSLLPVPGAAWLLTSLDSILAVLLAFLGWLGDNGLSPVTGKAIPAVVIWAGMVVLVLLLTPVSMAMKRAGFVLAAALLGWSHDRLAMGEFRMDVLDVGMGTSVVVQTRNHSLVYDVGPGHPGGFSAADWSLIPFLRSRGIETPDLLVISHVDQDHSGGFRSLVGASERIPTLTGTPEELRRRFAIDQAVQSCHEYSGWTWDGVRFRFLAIDDWHHGQSTNNRSCVLLISGQHRALLPGDIESAIELRLVGTYGEDLRADIMLSSHHGSNTSSALNFLRQVRPAFVVHTVGRGNRWGFPHEQVVRRFEQVGSRQFRSDLHGSISFVSRARALDWSSLRYPPKRIWRRW